MMINSLEKVTIVSFCNSRVAVKSCPSATFALDSTAQEQVSYKHLNASLTSDPITMYDKGKVMVLLHHCFS